MKRTSNRAVNLIFVSIFLISTILGSAGIWPIPTAVADAGSDHVVDVGAPVYFDASGSSGVGDLEYTWYFRDGTVSTVDHPNTTHSFSKEGVYEIGLLVEDENGYFDLDTVQVVVRNFYPVADAGSDHNAEEDENIEFHGFESSGAVLDVVSYEWDFGDGTTDSGSTVSKLYENEGNYCVTLTITDDDGAYDKDIIMVTVENVKPTADGIVHGEPDDEITIFEDEFVGFNASTSTDTPSDIPTLKYSWDFGDESQGYGSSTFHKYTKAGTYTAILTVTDDNDEFHQDPITINVLNADPVTEAGKDHDVDEGSSLFYDGSLTTDTTSDEPLLNYQWDFETDGSYDDIGWQSKRTWWDDGIKKTTLDSEDDDGVHDIDSQTVTINNVAPHPSIFNYSVAEYTIVDFGLRIAGEKWHDVQLWLYENSTEIAYRQIIRYPGSPNDQMDFVYNISIDRFTTYKAIIEYTPEDDPINGQPNGANPCWLILYLEDGNEFRFHRAFNYNKPDEWIWEIDLSSIVKVTFKAEIYDPGMDSLTFNWDFGDSHPHLSHSYPNPGTYPTKTTDSAVHIYVTPGAYNVILSGQDDDGGSGIYYLELVNAPDSVSVDNLAPRAFSEADIYLTLEDEFFEFSGSAIDLLNNNLTYRWDFDDHSSTTGQVVTHSYRDEGIYLVTLTVTDSLGASGKSYLFVTVENVKPECGAGYNQSVNEDDIVEFDATAWDTPSDQLLLSYAWDFGDGSKGVGRINDHVYTKNGIYTVTLTVQDNNGAFDTDILEVWVNNPGPYNPEIEALEDVDEDQLIFFTGSASDTPSDEPLLTYSWNFGDGIPASGRNPTHSYSHPGTFLVELTITDDDGSSIVTNMEISVSNIAPLAYAGSAQINLYGPEVTWEFQGRGFDTFSDLSSLTYTWDLGGGAFEYTQDISVTFSSTDIYVITLEVTDLHLLKSATQTMRIDFTLDSDGDLITDEEEMVLGTDPYLWDSDGDNLLDFWEIYSYPTDPLVDDTDSDGLNDWHEITHFKLTDPDGDGLVNPLDWDSDGEWIMDGLDTHPLEYNDIDGTVLSWDAIKVRNNVGLGVSVVMYGGTCFTEPTILNASPPAPIDGNIGVYFEVQSSCTPPFDAQIRVRYDESALPSGSSESTLVLFEWVPALNSWRIEKESGVDTTHDFVWAKVKKFAIYAIVDSSLLDSDGDGLSDYYELTTEYYLDFAGYDPSEYTPGTPLYIGNSRRHVQIPPSKLTSYGWFITGTVDLFSLGFTSNDFAKNDIWALTDDGTKIFVTAEVMKLTNVESAQLTVGLNIAGKSCSMLIKTVSRTDPFNPDSDGDGFSDGIEVDYHIIPVDPDTDDDGVLDGSDYDPLVDLEVSVHIKEIMQHDTMDLFDWDHSDFYVRIEINGVWGESPKLGLYQYGHKVPNYVHTVDVPDDFPLVAVKIEVWDQDAIWDSQVDISRTGRTVIVVYNLRNGKWTGHDHAGDRNGFGHASGYEDYNWYDGNADIWFDIYQNDYDGDKLTFYQEVYHLGTNPISAEWDSDLDTMPDWWEVRYGFDRLDPSDAGEDPDDDHLLNKQEYIEGTDPLFFEINLIVALNWSADRGYLDDLVVGLKRASDFLFDATDGHIYFRRLTIYNGAYNTYFWNNSHIRIYEGTGVMGGKLWPVTVLQDKINPYKDKQPSRDYIKMPQYLQVLLVHMPSHGWWYQALVHECGHYIMGCYDEYKDADDRDYPLLLGPDTLMENPALWVEMSTNTTYVWWFPPLGYKTTKQMAKHKRNCWDTFHYYYRDMIYFDLDRDGTRDSTYPYSYVAIGGPYMSIEGGYTKVRIKNP